MFQPERNGIKFTVTQRAIIRAEVWKLHQQGELTQLEMAARFNVSQATISNWIRTHRHTYPQGAPHEKIAANIRAELVCCDVYERYDNLPSAAEQKALKLSSDFHAMCFYGEWAARIAEQTR